jgi:predicted house-cleaning noncanonical NTP pyrophosphatase (MazG superfamily)
VELEDGRLMAADDASDESEKDSLLLAMLDEVSETLDDKSADALELETSGQFAMHMFCSK